MLQTCWLVVRAWHIWLRGNVSLVSSTLGRYMHMCMCMCLCEALAERMVVVRVSV